MRLVFFVAVVNRNGFYKMSSVNIKIIYFLRCSASESIWRTNRMQVMIKTNEPISCLMG